MILGGLGSVEDLEFRLLMLLGTGELNTFVVVAAAATAGGGV